MNKRRLLSVILVVVSAGLAVLAYILLPETVVIQISAGSNGNSTAPKLLAILLPAALALGGSVYTLFSDNAKESKKSLIVSVIGVIIFVIMLVVNMNIQ